MKLISFPLACMLVAMTAAAEDHGARVKLVTAPDGEYTVAWASSDHLLWLLSAKDSVEIGHIKLSYISDVDEGSEFTPLPFISPDSNWIFVPSRHADFAPTIQLPAFLLHRVPSKKPSFEFVLALEFDRRAWEFLVNELKLDIGEVNADAHRLYSVQFVDWSGDSSRLLISVGSAVVSSKDDWLQSYPAPSYFCYFNTRSSNFELTERLRNADNIPRARSGESVKLTAVVASAESAGKEGPEASYEEGFKNADNRLNEVYGRLIAKLDPPQQQALREEERVWIASRDDEATVWALQTWSTDYLEEVRTLERQTTSTEERIRELEKRLER